LVTLKNAASQIQNFETENLGNRIAQIERSLEHASQSSCQSFCVDSAITSDLLNSALFVKRLAGQINVVIHAVGILISLPYILVEGETIEKLSLGAGNTGKSFDLETNQRIAEFKFIHWKGGPEAIRENQLFKDFFLLAESKKKKDRYLYVVDDAYPLKFFAGGRALTSVMSRNVRLLKQFQALYQNRFKVVSDYYNFRKSCVSIVDLKTIIPQFANGFELEQID
jgi:hypothetical protein